MQGADCPFALCGYLIVFTATFPRILLWEAASLTDGEAAIRFWWSRNLVRGGWRPQLLSPAPKASSEPPYACKQNSNNGHRNADQDAALYEGERQRWQVAAAQHCT